MDENKKKNYYHAKRNRPLNSAGADRREGGTADSKESKLKEGQEGRPVRDVQEGGKPSAQRRKDAPRQGDRGTENKSPAHRNRGNRPAAPGGAVPGGSTSGGLTPGGTTSGGSTSGGSTSGGSTPGGTTSGGAAQAQREARAPRQNTNNQFRRQENGYQSSNGAGGAPRQGGAYPGRRNKNKNKRGGVPTVDSRPEPRVEAVAEESIFSSQPFTSYAQVSVSEPDPMPEPEYIGEQAPAAQSDEPYAPSKTRVPDFSAFDFDDAPAVSDSFAEGEETVEVVGVRFKRAGKVYYFAPGDLKLRRGDFAIVETARGSEYGEVWMANRRVREKDIILPLRPVLRAATVEDTAHNDDNQRKEKEAFDICVEKIAKHGLDMKLVDAQYTFDNSKLLFYFTSAGRVDFRDLVKDLASVFRTRIELRQIGIRDEAKLLGGLGACGRSLCCSSFLSDFVQVSIKMAKEQSLSLNSNKISGACGRLMCCLRYEYDTYVDEIRRTPPTDTLVRTVDGDGVITEINPLAGTVKVRLNEKQDTPPKFYNRDDVKVISRPSLRDGGEQESE